LADSNAWNATTRQPSLVGPPSMTPDPRMCRLTRSLPPSPATQFAPCPRPRRLSVFRNRDTRALNAPCQRALVHVQPGREHLLRQPEHGSAADQPLAASVYW
jgi:hypothetical protein